MTTDAAKLKFAVEGLFEHFILRLQAVCPLPLPF